MTTLKTRHLTLLNEPFALRPDSPESAWMAQFSCSPELNARFDALLTDEQARTGHVVGSDSGQIGRWLYDMTGHQYHVFNLQRCLNNKWLVEGITH